MTYDEIFTAAQTDAKNTTDTWKGDARIWSREALNRISAIIPRKGEWAIAVVSGTDEYDYTDIAIAVPQGSVTTALTINGMRSAFWLPTGATTPDPIDFIPEDSDRNERGIRIANGNLVIQPEPESAGTLTIYGDWEMTLWASSSQDATTPQFDARFHYIVAKYIAAFYWLIKRQRHDMFTVLMDAFSLGLSELEGTAARTRKGQRRIRAPRWT